MKHAYQQSIEEIKNNLQTDLDHGLSRAEVAKRLERYGQNTLPEEPRTSILMVFIAQFQNPLIYILLCAAIIIFFAGNYLDAFVISGVLFFNAIIGTIQEGRSRTILESLKRYLKSDAIVLRDGIKLIIEDTTLVPGDIIILQEGEKIPADARIIESNNLSIDESMLTGESQGIKKNTIPIKEEVEVYNQKNIVFKGTYVLSGAGKALVVKTGTETEIGKLHHIVETVQTDTPLKKSLDQLARWILMFIFVMCLLLFCIGLLFGKPITELLVLLTALFICVIPEGLPVVFTLSLVSGAKKMFKKNVLVRRLQAVEGLGRIDILMIDKTGTLTRNEMMVSYLYSVKDNRTYKITGQGYIPEGFFYIDDKKIENYLEYPNLVKLGHIAALLNRTQIQSHKYSKALTIKGNATEAAALIFAKKLGYTQENLKNIYELCLYMPYNSQKKYQVGIYAAEHGYEMFLSGAPEILMQDAINNTQVTQQHLAQFLHKGYRVIAIAYKKLPDSFRCTITHEDISGLVDHDIEILGFLALEDAIRSEAKAMVEQVRAAGLRVIMATGDHKSTALHVAHKTGIFTESDDILDGNDVTSLSPQEIRSRLPNITVISRATPEQKLKIVHMWQATGKRVAMTGDGVNDAPSLVAADLGITLSSTGTEVAKQASDIILLNDSFKTVIDAIKEGRNVFYTLRRIIFYFFTTNMGEILLIFFTFLANLPLPLLPAQILWLNLITDGFLDSALVMEPQESGILLRKTPTTHLINSALFLKMLYMSLPMAAGSLFIFLSYKSYNIMLARTMTLVTMALFQWFNAWNCRSERLSLFQLSPFSNKWLILATSVVFLLQIVLLENSYMQTIFKTTPLTLSQWGIILAVTSPILLLGEIQKYFIRKQPEPLGAP